MRSFIFWLIAIFGLISMSSCTQTKYVEKMVEVVKKDTLYQVKIKRDSIHLKDSIYLNVYTKGDTVYRDKYRERVQYINKLKTDTVYKSKVDTVYKNVTVEKIVQNPGTWFFDLVKLIAAILLLVGGIYLWMKN